MSSSVSLRFESGWRVEVCVVWEGRVGADVLLGQKVEERGAWLDGSFVDMARTRDVNGPRWEEFGFRRAGS